VSLLGVTIFIPTQLRAFWGISSVLYLAHITVSLRTICLVTLTRLCIVGIHVMRRLLYVSTICSQRLASTLTTMTFLNCQVLFALNIVHLSITCTIIGICIGRAHKKRATNYVIALVLIKSV
jgi:hypothetical protein